ncbi:arginyl-tRNA synthetase [Candidatus Kinetoplastibacterium blastocrithidii TCC012E]|uniref:Arginine--tRNA ligase n=1 Tax=Candidatus Kinetoplastidibacterium blastocrithidiae TCC012E TaxID=1208922 RepID=M1LZG9_9PROT|nr:arginine--tRNA ligase [Candidatus Kinetoplastibacterium blastocrithidii]AFZ83363.1 arginyl-tRNA synthetase [Candidatus Kinetoplastibacterium blastocrithidii (ex Strigomonas culicis)]AGF49461.1 arginyl-tRNA synthetase [Candidatus Kinetoplastibacterium blastocrithidii TCC012E]
MLLGHKKQIISSIQSLITKNFPEIKIEILLEKPKIQAHGDISTNIAMRISKMAKTNPQKVATLLVSDLLIDNNLSKIINKIEIAGPGFINFYLSKNAIFEVIPSIEKKEILYGYNNNTNKKILIEYVSANPTGPLHVGHARQAAIGDAICKLYKALGWKVFKEFYYNDAGNQINNLALSVQKIAKGNNIVNYAVDDNDLYKGDYISDIANDFINRKSVQINESNQVIASGNIDSLSDIKNFAVAYLRREQDLDLKSFGTIFDNYYLESSLYTSGKVSEVVKEIDNNGYSYEKDGAVWLRTTDLNTGDDKDRVMRKSTGEYTYFLPDVAYHKTKWDRGFHYAINIQGSDHHGTIARVRAGLQALNIGIPKEYPSYVLHKMVKIVRNGEEVKVSKRAGNYVTMHDIVEWVGRDAARYFLIQRRSDTEFIFDIDLAISKSEDNPVFYIQYAYARINSVINKANVNNKEIYKADLSLLNSTEELSLIKKLSEFPETVYQSATELSPHNLAFWLRDFAYDCHAWYNSNQIISEQLDIKLSRLRLGKATLQILKDGLEILGISAPDRM